MQNANARPAFDRPAYDRLKLARRVGEAIAAWDDPEHVPPPRADHMRADDLILGVVVEGRPRAYPIWILDHYHVVNDRIGDRRFLVTSCERCGSGSAFFADPPGPTSREPLFRAGGLLDAVLLMIDTRSGSHWLHYEGVGLDRRAAGMRLPAIPTYLMEWADWCALHPGSEVWTFPDDPRHPDGRHGHGREEFFARPGMEPALLETMTGPYDTSYPENEMALGIGNEDWAVAFPLREVHAEGGVVHDETPTGRIVVVAGPRPDGVTMAAFDPGVDGRDLTLVRRDASFVDLETGSTWTIEGVATDGELAGTRLEPVAWSYVRWHAWVNWHRTTRLFRSRRRLPLYGRQPEDIDVSDHALLLESMIAAGHEIRVAGSVVTQRRPRRSRSSLEVEIDGEPVIVHAFADEAAAEDHETLHGAWSALPVRARVLETRVRRIGRSTIEANPRNRFVDPAQVVPISWNEVRWPQALESPVLSDGRPSDEDRSGPPQVGFVDVLRALRIAGYDVVDVGYLPPGQLRVGAVDGIALTVNADRMLLYLFRDAVAADEYANLEPHASAFGYFVLRSTPESMYVHPFYEILYVGDDRVSWSPLIDDPRLRAVMLGALDRASHDQGSLVPADALPGGKEQR